MKAEYCSFCDQFHAINVECPAVTQLLDGKPAKAQAPSLERPEYFRGARISKSQTAKRKQVTAK